MASATISISPAEPRRTRSRRRRAHRSAAVWRLVGPLPVRIVVATALLLAVWATVNWLVQVARKPTEIFFPVSGSFVKAPAQTWREYGPLFAEHSTTVITPELLAALAQVEGSGNPMARTYWRWRLSWNPFEVYRPASSAVGMFQITDGTFAEARHYCIHNHIVVEDGPWDDARSCWFKRSTRAWYPGTRWKCRSAARSHGRAHPRAEPHRHRLAAAATGPRSDHPFVREWSRQRLCAPRVPAHTRPAMRRSRRPPLPGRRQRAEASVRAARRVRLIAGHGLDKGTAVY